MLMRTRADASANRRPTNRWIGLAAVARERASEQSAKAIDAPDNVSAAPHLEQQAYLVKLAEVYEERARTARYDRVDNVGSVFEGGTPLRRVEG